MRRPCVYGRDNQKKRSHRNSKNYSLRSHDFTKVTNVVYYKHSESMTSAWTDKSGKCTSPAANTLAAVLRTFLMSEQVVCRDDEDRNGCYRVCSYREDFEYLWALGRRMEEGQFPIGQKCTYIIVWDGMPPAFQTGLIHTEQYLTPLDWAVGFSLAAQSQGGEALDFRILVLDLSSRQLTGADNVHYFAQFPTRGPLTMPWIRVFRPVGDDEHELGAVEDLDLVPVALLADLHKHCLPFFAESAAAERSSVLAMVRRLWGVSLSQPAEPGDHHALANLVGPLLLRATGAGDARARALHVLLKQVGLVPGTLIECSICGNKIARSEKVCANCQTPQMCDKQFLLTDNNSWVHWNEEPWGTVMQRVLSQDKRPLRFLLVDDNAFQTRWAELVCMSLGARTLDNPQPGQPILVGKRDQNDSPLEVYAVESAEQWLTYIPGFSTTGVQAHSEEAHDERSEAAANQRFRFACALPNRNDEDADSSADVLLLDLRLHQGKSLAVEAGFFQQLLHKAEKFCIDDPHREPVDFLPWPGFTRAELDLMIAWVREALEGKPTARREDPRYHRALTLLPRLISLIDCSLPIVLFSSTGRREILEFLKPYENIITAFEKPRLAAIPDLAITGHTADKFQIAILAALHLVAARRMCGRLPAISARTFNLATPTKISQTEGQVWKIDLMLDEEGNAHSKLTLGGVLAVYPPAVSPEKFDQELGLEHSKIRDNKDYSRDHREEIANDLENLCERRGVFVAAVSVTGQFLNAVFTSLDQSDDLHDERVADNLHRQLFRYLVESAIYYLARHYVPSGATTEFCVRAAARHVPFRNSNSAKRLEDALLSRWGLAAEYIGTNEDLWNAKKEIDRWLGYTDNTDPLYKAAQELADTLGKIMEDPVIPKKKPVWSARYFRWDSPRPIVEEIMGHYQGSSFCPRADIVRAYSLNAHGRRVADDIPLLHFFADALLADKGTTGPSLKQLWDNGFRADYGADLAKAIESHRFLLQGFFAESLTAYTSLNAGARSDKLICDIGSDLHLEAAAISGAELLRFSHQLQEMGSPLGSQVELTGMVSRHLGNAGLYIRDASGREFWAYKEDCEEPWSQFARGTKVVFVGTRGSFPGEFLANKVRKKLTGTVVRVSDVLLPISYTISSSLTEPLIRRPVEFLEDNHEEYKHITEYGTGVQKGRERKLFVGGLSWSTTDDSLRAAFERFGKIVQAQVITDRESGSSRGFGFVTFIDGNSAQAAMIEMNGAKLDGRSIKVMEAENKGSRGGRSNKPQRG